MVVPVANGLPKLRVALLLPGLGRVQRGAETAFLELARGLKAFPDVRVELFGGGDDYPAGLTGHTVPCLPRERFERWPQGPVFRNEYCYEELSFVLSLISRRAFNPRRFDVAVHCSFPFTNWMLRRAEKRGGAKSVFVTQNGDWMCRAAGREYRTFRCAGLVCTNPDYYARHRTTRQAALIPNGVDPAAFRPRAGVPAFRRDPRLPADKKVVLMAGAMIPSKRVADGVRAVAKVPDAFLLLAGDGPERQAIHELAARELPGRHLLLGSVHRDAMPDLYRQADAFLHASRDEPFGIVYLEAAATGLPVVAHDGPVPRWILGDAGLFADTADAGAVAATLREALAAGPALGEAARARVLADWTWAAQAAKYREFLCDVAHKTPVAA